MKQNPSENVYNIRHSAAHILAQAVCRLFPGTKQVVGPVTESGFFADLLVPTQVKESDLEVIEAEMQKIIKENLEIIGKTVTKNEAKQIYAQNVFKQDILDRIEDDQVTIYSQGEYHDLCRGGHTQRTSELKFFKLMSVSGSQWNRKNEIIKIQRIAGIAFETKSEQDKYLEKLELAKKYDHRTIGKQLDYFSFLEEAPGMAFWKPKGFEIYNRLINFIRTLLKKYDYQEIKTPLLLKEELWHKSGHYDNYKENMFFCESNKENYCLRPMNCPPAMLLFDEKLRSYNDLPLRLAEFGQVHRYELSGVLHGLFRVRTFTQDDAHIFVTEEKLMEEIRNILQFGREVYQKFSFNNVKYFLSTRPEKSIGDDNAWEFATKMLKNALEAENIDFTINEGDGAFYGPKIDIKIEDALEREWQCGTIQIDSFMPERFKLSFVNSVQQKKTPIVLHRAILGSIERFLGIILEHYKGILPFWLAPVQIKILTVTDKQKDYALTIAEKLKNEKFFVETDLENETISAKIKMATNNKIPAMIIIGAKEVEQNLVTLRLLNGQQFNLSVAEVVQKLQKESFF